MEEKKPLYHNRMEDVVLRYLDKSMSAAGCRTCEPCKIDVVACALNHLLPRYIRTASGATIVD